MAIHNATRQSIRSGSPLVSKTNRVPAPIGGIDARTILSSGDPNYCIYSYNLLPSQYGMQVRRGYREWQIGLDNGNALGVGTIIPFGGTDNDASNDRLFAVTNEGIWDCTVYSAAPVLVLDFLLVGNGQITTQSAGKGVYCHYLTLANETLLFYADSENGLFQYSELTDSWARATGIISDPGASSPLVLENVVFVMNHKDQLWLVEKNESKAWYLPANSVAGEAFEFFFGPKYKHGGDTAGIFSWSIDGGEGLDDYLAIVSRAGDVLVYQGTDPSSVDTWSMKGQYFIGQIPRGYRFGSEDGGNLQLLSIYGLTAMDEIVQGVDGKNINAQTEALKIAAIIRRAMVQYRNDQGWDVKVIPSQGSILISQPEEVDGTYIQYAMNTTTSGWGLWRGVPMECFDEWNGKVYVGTKDSRVVVMDVGVDNSLITPVTLPNGDAIDFSILTTFQDYDQPAQFKRGKYIRPEFLSNQQPSFTAKFRYDYNLGEVLNSDKTPLLTSDQWDVGLWDQALWSGGITTGFHQIVGGWGMGRNVAIAMSGKSRTDTTLISWDVVWDAGAPL